MIGSRITPRTDPTLSRRSIWPRDGALPTGSSTCESRSSRGICAIPAAWVRVRRFRVLAQNTTDIFEAQFACFRLGAIFVPLNWRLALAELRAIIADCSPTVLIHDEDFAGAAKQLARDHPIAHLCLRGPNNSPYERAIAEARRLDAVHRATHEDACTILYTSGTTGLPKGAIITHGMTVWNAVNSTGPALISSVAAVLSVLPLFHTGGLNVFANPVFHSGGAVLVMRSFDPGEALRLFGDPALGITHFFGVPAHYQFMAQHPSFATTDLSRLAFACIGAAPAAVSLIEAWQSRGVILQQGYGMTETGPLVLILGQSDAARKAGSAGKPVLHTEVRTVDLNGRDVDRGEVGEIWVRGPNVTPGYWRCPEATRAAFTDGWLHTGDAAVVDNEGFFTIVDRWKDMYISGGENVYPAEVENVIYQLPAIAEAAVIGVPDARWGEVGRAVVALKPGESLTELEIISHCAAHLARYKLPGSIAFTEVLPRNATGKLHKPTLREQFGGDRA